MNTMKTTKNVIRLAHDEKTFYVRPDGTAVPVDRIEFKIRDPGSPLTRALTDGMSTLRRYMLGRRRD